MAPFDFSRKSITFSLRCSSAHSVADGRKRGRLQKSPAVTTGGAWTHFVTRPICRHSFHLASIFFSFFLSRLSLFSSVLRQPTSSLVCSRAFLLRYTHQPSPPRTIEQGRGKTVPLGQFLVHISYLSLSFINYSPPPFTKEDKLNSDFDLS